MEDTKTTVDQQEIEEWITNRDGIPSRVPDSFSELRVDFEGTDELEEISWKEFFEIFESENLEMEYEEEEIGADNRPPKEKYDFVKKLRTTSQDISETQMDDEQVKANTEETSG